MKGLVGSLVIAALATVASPAVPAPGQPAALIVDRVVIVTRHGVRPPTKAPAMPASVTPERWPHWPVAPGWLTPHGAKAITAIARYDRATLDAEHVLGNGCPAPDTITIIADSDQRTIETARNWAAGFAPGCTIPIRNQPQDSPDPLFSGPKPGAIDSARAMAAVDAAVGPGGIATLEQNYRPLLRRLDAILCGGKATSCGVGTKPSAIEANAKGRPKLSGALDQASTAAQILLLEYADGKPLAQVGWGRATGADVTALSAFHALEFRLLARPPYLASRNFAGLAGEMRAALTARDGPSVMLISGHDTNVANLGGLLGVHWHVPGFAPDDPAPGGAIVIERLHDPAGQTFVRAFYRSQSLDAIRAGAPVTAATVTRQTLRIGGCTARGTAGLCSLDVFLTKIGERN